MNDINLNVSMVLIDTTVTFITIENYCPNLQVNYDRAMEPKTKHYQGTKLKAETASSSCSSTCDPSASGMV